MPITPLSPLAGVHPSPGPLVLVIMDGIGLGSRDERDGVFVAHTPVLDALFQEPLMTRLKAHGKAVGLPSDEDMGNSEVGHNALGAGRVFSQGAMLVNEAIASGRVGRFVWFLSWNSVPGASRTNGGVESGRGGDMLYDQDLLWGGGLVHFLASWMGPARRSLQSRSKPHDFIPHANERTITFTRTGGWPLDEPRRTTDPTSKRLPPHHHPTLNWALRAWHVTDAVTPAPAPCSPTGVLRTP